MTAHRNQSGHLAACRVSIVVPAMNEALHLAQLLDSIHALKQTADVQVLEIIVVDADSNDGTSEIASANNCVVLPARPGNVSTSRNLGASVARGNILAFVDADCELPSNWLTSIARELHEDVIATGTQMSVANKNAPWVEQTWYQLAHRTRDAVSARDTEWLPTFNLAVKRDAFERVGGFNEALTTCEDVDLGYRLSPIGRLRLLSTPRVVHHGESKTVTEFFRREAWRARGTLQLMAQHRSNAREICSAVLPFGILLSLLTGATMVLTGLIGLVVSDAESLVVPTLAGLAGILPVILLVARRRVALRVFLPAVFLLSVYFLARCWGSVRPVNRVARPQSEEVVTPIPRSSDPIRQTVRT